MFAYFRLYVGSLDVEVEWLVGPIPISDGIGKEIIAKYSADVESNGEFYTDSNGRQMLKRKRDYRPTWKLNVTEPVSGNYYPINSRMFIKDEHHQQVCIMTFFMTAKQRLFYPIANLSQMSCLTFLKYDVLYQKIDDFD